MNLQTGWRWLAVAVILGGAVGVSGQSAAPPQQDDVLGALLVEVKGLRAAMEQMASAGPRVQLFASRLQLQEARMTNMMRRLDAVRDNLAVAQREVARLQADERRMEAVVTGSQTATTRDAIEEGRQAGFMLKQLREQIGIATATATRHTTEETQLLADLTTEQGRWLAINQQLDELERVLAKR